MRRAPSSGGKGGDGVTNKMFMRVASSNRNTLVVTAPHDRVSDSGSTLVGGLARPSFVPIPPKREFESHARQAHLDRAAARESPSPLRQSFPRAHQHSCSQRECRKTSLRDLPSHRFQIQKGIPTHGSHVKC